MSESTVISDLGAQLCVALLAPFATPIGQKELVEAHGVNNSAELFDRSIQIIERLRDHPVTHAAVGAFLRNSRLPDRAQQRLGRFGQNLPSNPVEAQRVLDLWASDETFGIVEKFPTHIDESTRLVLATALAVKAAWANPVSGNGSWFQLGLRPSTIQTTRDDEAVVIRAQAWGDLVVHFVSHRDGVDAATEVMDSPGDLDEAAAESAWFEPCMTSDYDHRAKARIPNFKIQSTHNLLADAAKLGIVSASDPAQGCPGFGAQMHVQACSQGAVVEMSRRGVEAAAVTAVTLERAAAMRPRAEYEALLVDLTKSNGFAFSISLGAPDTPELELFRGTYVLS